MEQWLWGLRHLVRFESTVADFLGDDDSLSFLVDAMSVNTDILPLAEGLDWSDPSQAAAFGFPGMATTSMSTPAIQGLI